MTERKRSNENLFLTFAVLWMLTGLPGLAQERHATAAGAASFLFAGESEGQGTYRFVNSQASFNLKTVKGAPYSAEAVTTTTQVLPDGNRIYRESSSLVARDSEGRTRQELTLPNIGTWVPENEKHRQVLIHDPVENVSFTLNPEHKMARKSATPLVVTAAEVEGEGKNIVVRASVQVAEEGEKQNIYIVRRTPEGVKVENAQGEEIETSQVHLRSREHGTNFTFQTKENGEDGEQGQASVRFFSTASGAGPHVLHFDGSTELGEARTEDLGTKNMQGVLVEGTRTVHTIEAGTLGNEFPIEIVSERWYSPDLQTVVMTRHYDPRSGETVFELKNLSRDEPDPSLFEVPADYTINESNSFGYGYFRQNP